MAHINGVRSKEPVNWQHILWNENEKKNRVILAGFTMLSFALFFVNFLLESTQSNVERIAFLLSDALFFLLVISILTYSFTRKNKSFKVCKKIVLLSVSLELLWLATVAGIGFSNELYKIGFMFVAMVIAFSYYLSFRFYLSVLVFAGLVFYLLQGPSVIEVSAGVHTILLSSFFLVMAIGQTRYRNFNEKLKKDKEIKDLLFELKSGKAEKNSLSEGKEQIEYLLKKKDEAFEEISLRYNFMMGNLNCGFCLLKEEFQNNVSEYYFIEFNERLKKEFPQGEEIEKGKSIKEVAPNFYKHLDDNLKNRLLQGDKSLSLYTTEDGNKFFDVVAVKSGENLIGVFITDMTAKFREEDALHRSMERYRAVTENSLAGILIVDTCEKLTFTNAAFSKMLGYRQEELFGQFFPNYAQKRDIIRRLIDTSKKGDITSYETNLIAKGKSLVSVLISATHLRHPDGSSAGTLCVVVNVSELKQKEAELITARNKAQESDHLKSAFLANMSHEIRTPMNAIIGFSDLLSRSYHVKEKREKYLKLINNSSRSLLTLIDDIIDIAKLESEQLSISKEVCHVKQLCNDVFGSIKKGQDNGLIKPSIEFAFYPETDTDYYIYADETRVKQVLDKLLNNAIKYTDEGVIEFGYKANKNYVIIYVKDTGIGISDELREVIFERFRQGDNSFSKEYGGAGLGLTISKKITELMGGRLWFDSKEGVGSTFYFSMPFFNKERSAAKEINFPAQTIYNWEKKQIIIAEDDEANYMYLEELLEDTHAKIRRANNGEEVLKLVSENLSRIDLILMDIQMPGLDGYETTKLLKEQNSNIKVIAQTAHVMAEDRVKVRSAGFDGYISKPIIAEHLLERINMVLNN